MLGQRAMLRDALALQAARLHTNPPDYQAKANELTQQLDQQLTQHWRNQSLRDDDKQRLLNGVVTQYDQGHILRCLFHAGVEATNNRAERYLRAAVFARQVSPCSRNLRGARAFEAFTSVIQTLPRTSSLSIGAAFEQIFAPSAAFSLTKYNLAGSVPCFLRVANPLPAIVGHWAFRYVLGDPDGAGGARIACFPEFGYALLTERTAHPNAHFTHTVPVRITIGPVSDQWKLQATAVELKPSQVVHDRLAHELKLQGNTPHQIEAQWAPVIADHSLDFVQKYRADLKGK